MDNPSWFHSGELTEADLKQIDEILTDLTKKEHEKTWAAGHAITIAEDGWIVKVWADGRKEKIQRIGYIRPL